MNLRTRAEGRLFLRPRLAFVIAICLWTGATSVTGHEIGTTRVVATLGPDGEYTIVVSTDAAALLGRLEASAGRARSGALDPHEYAERIESLRAEFVRHVRISFDGRDVTPAFEYLQDSSIQQPADPLTPAVATVRLSGLSPAHARTFVWRYDLTSALYALTVHTAGGERATTVWLESDQNSQPFALDDPVAPSRGRIAATYFALGFTHIVPHGPDHILFVLGIFLLNRRLRPILWQVSAFTIAHSITLGLMLYGVVSLAPRHRRAADRLVDCVRRRGEPRHVRVATMAHRAGVRVRAAARHGLRRRAPGARPAPLRVHDRAHRVQRRRRSRATVGDRGRRAPPVAGSGGCARVPKADRRARLRIDRVDRPLLDVRALARVVTGCARRSGRIARGAHAVSLLAQREGEDVRTRRNRDVLAAIEDVSHR